MRLEPAPFTVTDWDSVEPERHPGDSGFALWRTRQFGEVRVRLVEYSPAYSAGHWCRKGHVIHCLRGRLDIELEDGSRRQLLTGQTYHVGDGDPAHRSRTEEGALLFIVD